MSEAKLTTLPNGLRIATDEVRSVETVALGVFVLTGSRNESPAEGGISHFLEHMAFKGTKTRSSAEIAASLENVGGYINAYTSRSSTAYHTKVLKNDVKLAIDILSDIVLNSVFDEKEMACEKDVVLQEIAMVNDTPDDLVFDYAYEQAFKDQAIGCSILGRPENVKKFTAENLRNYLAKTYSTKNIVISASGNVSHEEIVRLVEKYFTLNRTHDVVTSTAKYVGGTSLTHKDLEQIQYTLLFEGVSVDSPDYYAADILASILGGGMSSRLFQEIREKHGLVYNISAFASSYADCGLFGISAATTENELEKFTKLLATEIEKICVTPAGEIELMRAKAGYKAGLLMSFESMSARARFNAYNLLSCKRFIPYSEMEKEIDKIDAAHILKLAQKIFASPKTLAVLGKFDDRDTNGI